MKGNKNMKDQLTKSFKSMNFDFNSIKITEDDFFTSVIVTTKDGDKTAWNIASYLNETEFKYSINTVLNNENTNYVNEIQFMFEK